MATLEYERCRLAKMRGEKNQLSVRKIVDQINKKYLNLPTDYQLNRGNVERTVREDWLVHLQRRTDDHRKSMMNSSMPVIFKQR